MIKLFYKIILAACCLWFINWVYGSFYFFHENEISIYTEMCPFDSKTASFPKYCEKNLIYKSSYKVFPEEQMVVSWDGWPIKKYENCIVKDRANFKCFDSYNKDWEIWVSDERGHIKLDDFNRGVRNVLPIKYWYYNITNTYSQVINSLSNKN